MQRTTKQKEAILDAFRSIHRPLSIEELFHYAAGKVESINISTVYRTLKILIDKGVIRKVDIPGENIRYELVLSTHRHYFICQVCDKVYPLESCPHGLLDMVPPGFLLKGHSVTLSGSCMACISP